MCQDLSTREGEDTGADKLITTRNCSDPTKNQQNLLFAINVDWYFDLHWRERIFSSLTEGFQVTVTYSQTRNATESVTENIVPMTMERSSTGIFCNIRSFYQAARTLQSNNYDLIHAVTVKPNIYFGLLARFYALPVLMTIPGLGTVFSLQTVWNRFLQRIILLFYRLAGTNTKSFFAFENSQDRDRFLRSGVCGVDNSTVVAGAGIDVKKFRCSNNTCSPHKDHLDLLFAGRLLEGKGLESLVLAVHAINARERKVILHVAGIVDVDSREAIAEKTIKQWQEQGKINYLGQVEDMPSLLTRMDAVALPTTYGEGLPRILLEANACCLPVIASDVAGCNEFVIHNENGLLVRPGNIDELVGAIQMLLDPALRAKMGRAGRRKVEEGYAVEKVIAQYRTIYDMLTAHGKR